MTKRILWQDWLLLWAFFAVACLIMASGCERPARTQPVVLIFSADWCQVCPNDAEIAQLMEDHPDIRVLTFNIDEHPALAAEYHVTSVPRFFLCGDFGCQTTTSFAELKDWLNDL
jgi:thiol-disulfide isomerase/thioredoxin